jgi:hypothetical protein
MCSKFQVLKTWSKVALLGRGGQEQVLRSLGGVCVKEMVGPQYSLALCSLAQEERGFALPGTLAMLHYLTTGPKQWCQSILD